MLNEHRQSGVGNKTCFSFPQSEPDGQASGGSDSGEWIFTIREKDPKNLENGAAQPLELQRNKVLNVLIVLYKEIALTFNSVK